jgi:phospholipid/cholesterol/gamma-HCH transport system ATP-binding protein
MRDKLAMSSVTVTHDIDCVKMTADKILVLENGEIAERGTVEDLSSSSNSWIRAFFE